MKSTPDLLLAGYGVGDSLQVTVQVQQLLQKHGRVYVLNPPPVLRRWLNSFAIEAIDLSGYFDRGIPLLDAYLDVADLILSRAREERPVIVLMQDHPLLLNALGRFLLTQARQQGLHAVALPAVSQLDAVIAELGVDVAGHGLQVFDARRLVAGRQLLNPAMPAILLELGAYLATGSGEVGAPDSYVFEPLVEFLAALYPPAQPVTLVNTNTGAHATVTISRFYEFVPHIAPGCCLYLDRVR